MRAGPAAARQDNGRALPSISAARATDDTVQAARLAHRLDEAPGLGYRLKPVTLDLLTRAYNARRTAEGAAAVEAIDPGLGETFIGACTPSTVNNYAGELSRMLTWLNGAGSAPTTLIPATAPFQRYLSSVLRAKNTAEPTKKLFAAVKFFASLANVADPTADFISKQFKGAIGRKRGTAAAKKSPLFAADIEAGLAERARTASLAVRRRSSGAFNWHEGPRDSVLSTARELELRHQDVAAIRLAHLVWLESSLEFVHAGSKTDKTRTGQGTALASGSRTWLAITALI